MHPLTASGLFLILIAVLNWFRLPAYLAWQTRVMGGKPDPESLAIRVKVGRGLALAVGVLGVALAVAGLFS